MNNPTIIRVWNDKWGQNGKLFNILEFHRIPDSTAVSLTYLQDGSHHVMVLPDNEFEWIFGQ